MDLSVPDFSDSKARIGSLKRLKKILMYTHSALKHMQTNLPSPHYITIKRIENAFVGELQGVIQNFHPFRFLYFCSISRSYGLRHLLLGAFQRCLELVSVM